MRTCFPEDNPYQVKNKRFRRTGNETDLPSELSLEKPKGLVSIKSSIDIKSTGKEYEAFAQNKIKSEIIPKGLEKQQYAERMERAGSSLDKRQIKRKKEPLTQEENKEKEAYLHIIAEQKKRIDTLQQLLSIKETKVNELEIKIFQYQRIQEESKRVSSKLQEELTKTQAAHDEQTYKLKQTLKKLQIQINCTNRKWSLDFEKMLKEKDMECKQLRDKYTSLLRSKRLASKQSSVLSQNPTLTVSSQNHRFGDEILDFSSFQLSKDEGPSL